MYTILFIFTDILSCLYLVPTHVYVKINNTTEDDIVGHATANEIICVLVYDIQIIGVTCSWLDPQRWPNDNWSSVYYMYLNEPTHFLKTIRVIICIAQPRNSQEHVSTHHIFVNIFSAYFTVPSFAAVIHLVLRLGWPEPFEKCTGSSAGTLYNNRASRDPNDTFIRFIIWHRLQ